MIPCVGDVYKWRAENVVGDSKPNNVNVTSWKIFCKSVLKHMWFSFFIIIEIFGTGSNFRFRGKRIQFIFVIRIVSCICVSYTYFFLWTIFIKKNSYERFLHHNSQHIIFITFISFLYDDPPYKCFEQQIIHFTNILYNKLFNMLTC